MQLELRSRTWPSRSRALAAISPLWVVGAALALAGCGGDEPAQSYLLLTDENNYTSTSSFAIPTVETAAETDLDICWTDVAEDLQCHALAAKSDVDNVGLLRFVHLTEEDVEAKLAAGSVSQSVITGYVEHRTDHVSTCTKLSAFNFLGTIIDVEAEYLEKADSTYMLLFSKGVSPGVGARTMTFIKPTSTSINTTVTAPVGCGILTFSANLTNATPLKIPTKGPWRIDWDQCTRDSQGNKINFPGIDSVLLGFFGGMTVVELQEKLMDMELLASDIWEIALKSGRTADLANAHHRVTGERFPGFARSEEGVWAVGLMCSDCQNPAPVVLTVLEPGGE